MDDHQFWKILEDIPAQTAPWCEWRDALSGWAHFELFQKRYLLLDKHQASAVACVSDCPMFCPRQVVHHTDDDIVAVCPENESKPYPLAAKDILVYKLRRPAFHKDLCDALGIQYKESQPADTRFVWLLGQYKPREGYELPVYLIFPEDQGHLTESLNRICLLHETHFAVIIPTDQCQCPETDQLLTAKEAIGLTLDGEIVFDDKGKFAVNRELTDIFATFHATIPEPGSGELEQFPTPTGAAWEAITIEFVDGHTVSIRTGDLHRQYSYGQMGMRNKTNNTPDRHWTLLQKFAENRGVIGFTPLSDAEMKNSLSQLDQRVDTESGGFSIKNAPDKTMKKHKQGLSKALRAFFHLEDDPIRWIAKESCYRCRFILVSETLSNRLI
jgi:hypothetical protein